MRRRRRRLGEGVLPKLISSHRPLLLAAAAVIAVSVGLLRAGLPETHDGLFHFYRVLALADAAEQGCCYPRWLPQFAFGYGQPVFTFYGAVSYYQALSLMLTGLAAEAALKLSWLLGFLVAGAGAYGLARRWMSGWAAGLAGAAYVLFPYRLADVYVRGAFAEHWGLALMPLLLLAGERALRRRDRHSWATLALVWSVLVLTHHLSAFVAAPLLAAYLLTIARRRWRDVAVALAAPVSGTLLTAFYWLPILDEVYLVGLGQTFSTDAWARFLAPLAQTISPTLIYHYFPNQGVAHDYPIGLTSLLLALVAAGALLARRPQSARIRARLLFWGGTALLLWALQWSVSTPVWGTVPLLGFLQFPWRLMGPFALAWSLLLGAGVDAGVGDRPPLKGAVAVGAAVALAVTSLWALPSATVSASSADWVQAMWDHDAAIGQVGATWTAEYVPSWVTVDRSAMPWDPVESDRPPSVALPEDARVSVTAAGLYSLRAQISAPDDMRLAWHSFYYPGQTVTADGTRLEVGPYTDLGLASAEVPAGTHELRWSIEAPNMVLWGRVVTAMAAAGLALATVRVRRSWGIAIAVLSCAAVLWATGCEARETPVQEAWIPYGKDVALVGWANNGTVRPGDTLIVDLYWLARRTPPANYKVFVHLQSSSGAVRAQSDGDPVGGYTRTTRMVGGEISPDRRLIVVPEDAEPGRYTVYVGLYRWPEMDNLTVSAGEQAGSERALLGYVEVP